jgi:hypothetical protein
MKRGVAYAIASWCAAEYVRVDASPHSIISPSRLPMALRVRDTRSRAFPSRDAAQPRCGAEGKTPMQTFLDALPLAREKSLQVAAANQPTAA